jgi:hypothetical protein
MVCQNHPAKTLSGTQLKMKTVKIKWQRLISNKETCSRCRDTEAEIEHAVKELKKQKIKVKLAKKEINRREFEDNPQESNRIMINGKNMEEWLKAKTSSSCCCDACGDAECRTVEYDNRVYETIPAELIIRAALNSIK